MGLYKNNNGTLELISGATLYADNPIGSILPYGGATAPLGWLLCQGQAVSRTEYSELFAVIGTAFGNGDGTTTFNLPDPRNKFLEGASTTNPVGTEKSAGLPNIKGNVDSQVAGSGTSGAGAIGVSGQGFNYGTSGAGGSWGGTIISLNAHNSNAIYSDNVDTVQPPAVCTNYIIKAKQVAAPADFEGAAEAAGTAAAEEVVAQKVSKFSGTDSGNTYVTVDSLAYDQTNNALGLKVNGADTVIPFIRPNNFSTDARDRKPIIFAMDTYRMAVYDENTGEMAVDENYFEVISKAIQTGTHRIFSMQIKAKKSFSLRMYGGYYNGTFGFEPLFATTPSLGAINQTFNIVEGTTYTWNNYRSGEIDNASACCYGVVVSE